MESARVEEDEKCVEVKMTITHEWSALAMQKFVASDLSRCSQEVFVAEYQKILDSFLGGEINAQTAQAQFEAAKEALWRSVVNEIVIRTLATSIAEGK